MRPQDVVYNFRTANAEGFTKAEIRILLSMFPRISIKLFDENLLGSAYALVNEEAVFYKYDVAEALIKSFRED